MVNKRLIVKVFRDVAIVAFLVMFSHVVCLLMGHEFLLARLTFYMPLPVGVMSIALSELMNYCSLHRQCLAYATLVSYCMDYRVMGDGFGDLLTAVRLIMLMIGLFILCHVIRRLANKELWIRAR